jgi:K+/H+ antiporter YhaU regulatory subunit KhtT
VSAAVSRGASVVAVTRMKGRTIDSPAPSQEIQETP